MSNALLTYHTLLTSLPSPYTYKSTYTHAKQTKLPLLKNRLITSSQKLHDFFHSRTHTMIYHANYSRLKTSQTSKI